VEILDDGASHLAFADLVLGSPLSRRRRGPWLCCCLLPPLEALSPPGLGQRDGLATCGPARSIEGRCPGSHAPLASSTALDQPATPAAARTIRVAVLLTVAVLFLLNAVIRAEEGQCARVHLVLPRCFKDVRELIGRGRFPLKVKDLPFQVGEGTSELVLGQQQDLVLRRLRDAEN